MDGDGGRDRTQCERDRNIASTSLAITETRIFVSVIRGVYATISAPNSSILRPNGRHVRTIPARRMDLRASGDGFGVGLEMNTRVTDSLDHKLRT